MCLYWKGSDGNVMNVCGGIHARTLDLHGAFCLKVWWLSLTPILFISPLLLPSSVYTNVEIESLLTLLSPYSSIEQYFSYFPHNQLSLPLFSFHLHPITLPPRFPPASPSAILLPLFFFLDATLNEEQCGETIWGILADQTNAAVSLLSAWNSRTQIRLGVLTRRERKRRNRQRERELLKGHALLRMKFPFFPSHSPSFLAFVAPSFLRPLSVEEWSHLASSAPFKPAFLRGRSLAKHIQTLSQASTLTPSPAENSPIASHSEYACLFSLVKLLEVMVVWLMMVRCGVLNSYQKEYIQNMTNFILRRSKGLFACKIQQQMGAQTSICTNGLRRMQRLSGLLKIFAHLTE